MYTQAVTGQKVLLFAELWIFIIGNVIAGSAHNLAQLVGGQLVSGVGGMLLDDDTDEEELMFFVRRWAPDIVYYHHHRYDPSVFIVSWL